MDIQYVTHRLEIAFWQATIPLLRKRPDRRWPWLAIGALILVGVGFAAFSWYRLPAVNAALPAWWPRPPITSLQKVLVLVVEELPARRPLLKGAWLVNTSSGKAEWTISAIFPASLKDSDVQDAYLVDSFGALTFTAFRKQPALGEDFQQLLANRNLSWDGVVVLDENALAQLIDMMGGIGIAPHEMNGFQAVELALSAEIGNPAAIQAELIQSMCHQSIALFRDADPMAALDALSGHVYTDFPVHLWHESWFDMRRFGYGLVCKFANAQGAPSRYSSLNVSAYPSGDFDARDQ